MLCNVCHKDTSQSNGCTPVRFEIDGQLLMPLAYEGQELCEGCKCPPGSYHHVGCPYERCPVCRERYITCSCDMGQHSCGLH